ncbi:AcrR family transcriptional regulator [Actinoalloteichus hoggarensis]|uniref:Transcriptional regulator, TetR family n=1 Tax=Actinoalloteichus hoggarensis TaxID=1470176 RepID=A0A221W0G3_9PSEU|nr:TetR/AcrR family transcriptional regulator [Actinoalloteichus hoggarensis]ASO19273.1 Transcriptional regulator, TetR family [Actinoalloteichus hoggarensis]MBB5920511.1 AcrR family transcriptional regulator [Actinoalloteichus hoggarensis]
MQPERASGTVRPGGRTARTRRAVRDATLAELAAHGYQGLTVDNVAERSGVHKTTVYRRWGGVDGLVIDVLALAREDDWQPPDTGSLAGDLTALAVEVRDYFEEPTRAAAPNAFVYASFHSERAAAALRDFFADRHARCEPVITRAIARGEIPADTDPGAVARMVVAPLYHRLFITREPVDARLAEQSASMVLVAAQAGILRRHGSDAPPETDGTSEPDGEAAPAPRTPVRPGHPADD